MKGMINYDFSCINPSDWEALFFMRAKGKLFDTIFARSKEKLKRKGVVYETKSTPLRIDVPDNMYPVLNTIMKPIIRRLRNEVKDDGIELLSERVESAVFYKVQEDWNVQIRYLGQYADKR